VLVVFVLCAFAGAGNLRVVQDPMLAAGCVEGLCVEYGCTLVSKDVWGGGGVVPLQS